MNIGNALLVGLKEVSTFAYGGFDGRRGCYGCERDVDQMNGLLSPLGYNIEILKTRDATRSNILASLERAAMITQPGDIFVFYYTGHGGQKPDWNGDETDGYDETMIAYDGELIDDELFPIWLKFRPGVRILMLSDACNSETLYKMALRGPAMAMKPKPIHPLDTRSGHRMRASMIHFGAARDGESAIGDFEGGVFTTRLTELYSNGATSGGYPGFFESLHAAIANWQVATMDTFGPVDNAFLAQYPFTI